MSGTWTKCVHRCMCVCLDPHITVYLKPCPLGEHCECWGTWLCACTVVRACATGAGRRWRLLPAFSTHSASPQVACCEMSVAEKLKIPALLLLLTAWADRAVGPQQAPWALAGGGAAGGGAGVG